MSTAWSYLRGDSGDAWTRLGGTGTAWERLYGTEGDAWQRLTVAPQYIPAEMSIVLLMARPAITTEAPEILPPVEEGFMTVRDAIMELWDLSGHVSDLYPFTGDSQIASQIDINADGTQYFLRLLTQGQVALANWKRKDHRLVRFRQFYRHFNIQIGVDPAVYFTIQRNSELEFKVDPTQANWDMDTETLESSVMVYDGSRYKIMTVTILAADNWTFSIYPDMAEDETPSYPESLTDVQFAIAEFDLITSSSPPANSYQITIPLDTYTLFRIDDYQTNTEVVKSNDVQELSTQGEAFNTGTPGSYLDLGNKIIFDTGLLEKRWYKIEIFKQPTELDDLDQAFEIPAPYHQALMFWCMWKISLRERHELHAVNYSRLVDSELMRVRDEFDNTFERTKTKGFQVRRNRDGN